MELDVLAFAAHPDDVEMGMGGTIAKLAKQGLKTGIVDYTKGELGTRGTPELRMVEAGKSAGILKLAIRDNLGYMDGEIRPDKNLVMEAVKKIRQYRPKIVFANYFVDRHPDHEGCGKIIKEAMFFAGLPKYVTELNREIQEAYRPQKLFFYMMTYEFEPKFIVDISDTFLLKMASIEAFASQIFNPESTEPETFISQPSFYRIFEARARHFGFLIRKEFGEAFYCEEELEYNFENIL